MANKRVKLSVKICDDDGCTPRQPSMSSRRLPAVDQVDGSQQGVFNNHGYDAGYGPTTGSPSDKPDPEWVYIEKVKAWIYSCNTRRGAHCQDILKDKITPYWLIDAGKACEN